MQDEQKPRKSRFALCLWWLALAFLVVLVLNLLGSVQPALSGQDPAVVDHSNMPGMGNP